MAFNGPISGTTASSTAPYPQEKGATVILETSSHNKIKSSRWRFRSKYAFIALCYIQVGLLGCAEAIVSVQLAENGRHTQATTWLGLWNSLTTMSLVRNCLWSAFTVFDVLTLYLISSEARRLEGGESVWAAQAPSTKKWAMILQMVLLMTWVHGGAAWAMLKGPFSSTFGKGPDTVDWAFDVAVPLAITLTFFFTFVFNMERYCQLSDREHMEIGWDEEWAEYEITL